MTAGSVGFGSAASVVDFEAGLSVAGTDDLFVELTVSGGGTDAEYAASAGGGTVLAGLIVVGGNGGVLGLDCGTNGFAGGLVAGGGAVLGPSESAVPTATGRGSGTSTLGSGVTGLAVRSTGFGEGNAPSGLPTAAAGAAGELVFARSGSFGGWVAGEAG